MFSLQMQLTRSKLKYWTSSKSRCFAGPNDRCYCCCCWSWYCCWCCWHLPCLCIAAGKQYLFLTSSSVVGEPTSNTLRRLYGVRLHFVVQMVYMTILTIHPGMPIWKAYVHACCRQSERSVLCFIFGDAFVLVCRVPSYRWGAYRREPSYYHWYWLSLTLFLSKIYTTHIYLHRMFDKRNGSKRNAKSIAVWPGIEYVRFFFMFSVVFTLIFLPSSLHYVPLVRIQWMNSMISNPNESKQRSSLCIAQWHRWRKKQKHNTCFPHVCI